MPLNPRQILVASSAFAFLVLPWLNPFASGPSPSVVPLLVCWACSAACFTLYIGTAESARFKGCWVLVVASAWLTAGLISSGLGIIQYFDADRYFSPWVNHPGLGQAFANLRQRNQFATLTCMALASLCWLTSTEIFPRIPRFIFAWCAVILAFGNAASSSRTGLVQLLVLALLSFLFKSRRHSATQRLLLIALSTYGFALLALPSFAGLDASTTGLLARLQQGDELCTSRITLWDNVLHLISLKPWAGWGWGELDYAHYSTLYAGPRFCDILDNAHNLPLHLAVEIGLPAAVVVCGIFAIWAWTQKPWQETDPKRQLVWSVLALILLHSMLEYPLWYGPFQVAFIICFAVLSRFPWSLSAVARIGCVLATAVVAVVVAYVGWDYHRVSQIYLPEASRGPAWRGNTLEKIGDSLVFSSQVKFAELSITPLTRDNAQWTFATASELLHFSPEPKVIEKVIESAAMLGLNSEEVAHLARYRAAFPEDYALWIKRNGRSTCAVGAEHCSGMGKTP